MAKSYSPEDLGRRAFGLTMICVAAFVGTVFYYIL
mgnify:CR=1 FL=1|jgi:hypothetical protein